MRRLFAVIFLFIFLTGGCANSNDNITFTAVIDDISENSILVTVQDDVGFDKASVGFDKNVKIGFNLIIGQTVEIEILPQIRESYPVQVTAVKIRIIDK